MIIGFFIQIFHHHRKNKSYADIKYKNCVNCNMSKMAWKCYRCDLTFKEHSHAILHKNLERHDYREIKIAIA